MMFEIKDKKIELDALTYDVGFSELLKGNHQRILLGKVHSIFHRVVNLMGQDQQLYSIGNQTIDNGPFTARISLSESFHRLSLLQNDFFSFTKEKLWIGDQLVIGFSNAVLWKPRNETIDRYNVNTLKKNLTTYQRCLLRFQCSRGIVEEVLQQRISALLESLRNQKEDGIRESIIGLIGLGHGLTPSGDDFLAGFILICQRLNHRDANKIQSILQGILLERKNRTTDVSYQMLMSAIKGNAREIVDSFIEGLFQEDKGQFEKIVVQTLMIGSTSGLDVTLGIVTGLNHCLVN